MSIEQVTMTDRQPISLLKKLNPVWWLVGPDGWAVPTTNNGAAYLPGVKNPALRIFYWFFCRNPLMNFVGFVLGVEDKNYTVIGPTPVLLTTLRDATPPRNGWKWSVIWPQFSLGAVAVFLSAVLAFVLLHWSFAVVAVFAAFKMAGPMPFVSYNGPVEFYLGWRPASGGFGFKLVTHAS